MKQEKTHEMFKRAKLVEAIDASRRFIGIAEKAVAELDAIHAIVDGDVPAPMCGRCDYCASMSRVQIADCATSDYPLIDDVFGINV